MPSDISTPERQFAAMHGGEGMDTAKLEEFVVAVAQAGSAIIARSVSAGPYLEALVLLINTRGVPLDAKWRGLEAIRGIGSGQVREGVEQAELQRRLEAETGKLSGAKPAHGSGPQGERGEPGEVQSQTEPASAPLGQPRSPEAQIKDLNSELGEALPGESPVNPLLLAAEGHDTSKSPEASPVGQQPGSEALNDGLANDESSQEPEPEPQPDQAPDSDSSD